MAYTYTYIPVHPSCTFRVMTVLLDLRETKVTKETKANLAHREILDCKEELVQRLLLNI